MLVKNNWITTNIKERLVDRNVDFKVNFNFYPEKFSKNFKFACIKAVREINKFGDLYLSLSGGLDSTYIFKILVEQNIYFTPIIVVIKDNKINNIETQCAKHLCQKYNINPVIIEITELDLVKSYYNLIYKKLNCYGLYCVPIMLAAQYAGNGVLVTGESLLDDRADNTKLVLIDFDVATDALVDPQVVHFFLYSEDIVYHTQKKKFPDAGSLKRYLYNDTRIIENNRLDNPELRNLYSHIARKVPNIIHNVYFDSNISENFK